MDKRKTGNLIKEARIKSGYTQSELGTLIGVTNKAISRWENGESFPDVGVLEELSRVLNLDIKDIVTGESGAELSDAVTEITRVIKIQERERQSKRKRNTIFAVASLLLLFAGAFAFGRQNFLPLNPWIYYLIVAIYTGTLLLFERPDREISVGFDKCARWMAVICVLIGIYIVSMTIFSICIAAKNGVPTNIGVLVNVQLCISFWINAVNIIGTLFADMRWGSKPDFGKLVSLFDIYISVFYSIMLHNMSSFEGMLKDIVMGTIFTLMIIVLCYFGTNFVRRK